jgi:hypothetical protein
MSTVWLLRERRERERGRERKLYNGWLVIRQVI